MMFHWKIDEVPESILQNKVLLAEMVMTELGIDREEYDVGEKIFGSPFPFKLKWWQTSKRLCIYDATVKINKSGFEVLIRPLNLIYGPIVIPLVLLLFNGLDGFLIGLVIYLFTVLFFGIGLMIELKIAKSHLKYLIKSAKQK